MNTWEWGIRDNDDVYAALPTSTFNISSPGGNDTLTGTASYPSPSTFTNTPINDPSTLTGTMTWPQILAQRTPKHPLSITYNTHSLTPRIYPQHRCPLDGGVYTSVT